MEVTPADFAKPPHQVHPAHIMREPIVVGPVSVRTPNRISEAGQVVMDHDNCGTEEKGRVKSGGSRRSSRRKSGGRCGAGLRGEKKMVLRYASDSKESGWLVKEATRSKVSGLRKKGESEKKFYFKLRGSTLTAHPNDEYPEIWRSSVKGVKEIDPSTWRLSLKLEKNSVDLRAESSLDFERWTHALKKAAATSFEQHYKKVSTIGKGHFSVVYVAHDKDTGEKFAVKVIKKDKRDLEKSKKFIRREVKILSTTNHDNIIKAVDFFSSQGKPHIVLEYVEGGSLRDMISKLKVIPEPQAREIFRGIMEGVYYLHSNSIVHRDMKPENILMAKGNIPKITDFGLATFKNERKNIHSVVGTPSYVAPELIRNVPYGPQADIWSCGIILYFMLSGARPFVGDTREKMKKSVVEDPLSFPATPWATITPEARHLVSTMLDKNQIRRASAAQVLKHPWFVKSFARFI